MFGRILAVVLSVAVLAGAQSGATSAAASGSWNRVTGLKVGAEIQVKRAHERKTLKGSLVAASEDSIQIRSNGGALTSASRAEVERVAVAIRRKARGAAIGTGIGAGAGAGFLALFGALTTRPGAESGYTALFAFAGLVCGAGIGALLGLAAGSGHQVVYEAAPKGK